MQIRFKGYGFLLFLVPLFFLIGIRMIVGDWEESHRHLLIGIDLFASGFVLFEIAKRLDRKIGIEVWSRAAWTTDLFESHHLCWNLPLRLAGIILALVGLVFLAL
jgi:hypothetical protein